MTTTDLVVRTDAAAATLDLAPRAWDLAQQIARTEFVPGSLRGKPEAVLACILTGHELGIGPMQALAKIHVIDGRPAMAAELMRAVILAAGHEIWVEESSSTRVTVGGKRSDSTRETRVSWTMDDAKKAELSGRKNWRSYPRAMLLARATAELARAIFPDVLSGISYTVEELDDEDGTPAPEDLAAPPADTVTAKKTATRKAAAPKRTAATKPAAGTTPAPPLPGEEDVRSEIEPGVLVDRPGEQEPDPGDEHVEHEANPLPGPAAIATALKAKGITDRDAKLRIVENVLGRDEGTLESTKDLGADDVALALRSIAALSAEDLADLVIADADVVETEDAGPRQDPPAPARDTAEGPPSSWSSAAWRVFLSERGVKVTELIKEAQRLAREDGDQGPTSLDALSECSPSLLELLIGYVEDRAAGSAS